MRSPFDDEIGNTKLTWMIVTFECNQSHYVLSFKSLEGSEALKKIVIAEMRWIPRDLGSRLAPPIGDKYYTIIWAK